MPRFQPGLPQAGEFHAAFAAYIAKAQSAADPVDEMERQLQDTLSRLRALSADRRLYRYAWGKWSIQEVLGHMIDTERVFAYRALCIARGDQTPFPGFEENDYAVAAESERCEWGELLEEFEQVRKSSILMFRHCPDSAWIRTGTVNGATTSVRALAYIMIGHLAHHQEILDARYL